MRDFVEISQFSPALRIAVRRFSRWLASLKGSILLQFSNEKLEVYLLSLLRFGFGGLYALNLRPHGPMIVCHRSFFES